ncbi:MAG: hypothetical protein M3Q07_25345 [Pseudobdellovibrionaceae bacterium]|nr:hypothetical protein [Pseudobdellovibrionaceae bacterium]
MVNIATVASYVGAIVDARNPILECEFPIDGSRFEAMVAPVVLGPTFSIRKKAVKILSLNDFVESGIMTNDQREKIADGARDLGPGSDRTRNQAVQ